MLFIAILIFFTCLEDTLVLSAKYDKEHDEKCVYLDGCTFILQTDYDSWYTLNYITQINCKLHKHGKFNFSALNESRHECGLQTDQLIFFIEDATTLDSSMSYILKLIDFSPALDIYVILNGIGKINVQSSLKLTTNFRYQNFVINFLKFDLVYVYDNGRSVQTCQDFALLNSSWAHLIHWQVEDSPHGLLNIEFRDVTYSKPVCELIFKNSRIEKVDFGDVLETYFRTSLPRFIQEPKIEHLNSSLRHIKLAAYNIRLDSRVLNAKIFGKLQQAKLLGHFESIQTNIFSYFKSLKSIIMTYSNFEGLTKRQGMNWLKSINQEVNIDLTSSNLTLLANNYKDRFCLIKLEYKLDENLYAKLNIFQDKDFCAYSDWPFEQLVFISTETFTNSNLTCLSFWLLQYHSGLKPLKEARNINFKPSNRCNFSKQLALCNRHKFNVRSTRFNSFEMMTICELLLIVASSIASLFGIVFNSLVIAVIVNKKFKKEFQKKHYTYMVIFSVSNLFTCACQLISLVNECQKPIELFCSSIRQLVPIQYLKLIFGEFFLYFFMSISNWTYVAFAICRLSLVGSSSNKLVKFISDVGVKKLTAALVLLSVALTIVKPFMFVISSRMFGDDQFPTLFYQNETFRSLKMSLFKLRFIANILYDFINYCVIVLINLIVDLAMLKSVRDVMREKEAKMSGQIEATREKVKKENDDSFELLTKFVALNSATNIALKIPSCVTSLNDFRLMFSFDFGYYKTEIISTNPFVFPYTMDYICVLARVCKLFGSFGHFLLLVSLSMNFFFLKSFDRNFKQAFSTLFNAEKNPQ